MSENHKYYYMKLKETFFSVPKVALLEQMRDGPLYVILLLKLYLMSLPYNGLLLIGDDLPHTAQSIAILTHYQVGTVERAIKIFLKFGLIEILANHTYYMTDIQLFIGQSSTEAERKRMERLRLQRQLPSPTVRADVCPPKIEIRDKERDRDKVRVREKEGQPTRSSFGAYQNVFLSDNELAELQNELPTSWQHYIDRLSEYMASSGRQYQNHAATIRRWATADQKKSHQQTYSRDYSVEEGETV